MLALAIVTLTFGVQFGVTSLGFPAGLLLSLPALACPFVVAGRHNRKVTGSAGG
ncbi:hypothetical protein [Cryobacterium roopkundense]|nr:hypothetical protein [Cryobacterium roopkundense]MBB5642240.1 hypothetical protein [Cryobacterium roopkundense]